MQFRFINILLLLLLQVSGEMAVALGASRDVIQTVFLMAVLLCVLTPASSECPEGCRCDMGKGTVKCTTVASFPSDLPAATKKLTFYGCNLNEIPTQAFVKFQQLRSVNFEETVIQYVRPRAFYRVGRGLYNKELSFIKVSIKEIGYGAFEELHDFTTISMVRVNFDNMSRYSFTNFNNITRFVVSDATMPVLLSDTFTRISNVITFTIEKSAFTTVKYEAFSHFTHINKINLFGLRIGHLGPHFMTTDHVDVITVVDGKINVLQNCAFCGFSAGSITIAQNSVKETHGNIFRGINATMLTIVGNTIPSIIIRFFSFGLPNQAQVAFTGNHVKTIMCDANGADYPRSTVYGINDNSIVCDCRLNWLWKKWNGTHAAKQITPGFICEGSKSKSVADYFKKLSTSDESPPCGRDVEPVNDCSETTTAPSTTEMTESTTDSESDTIYFRQRSAAAASKASWMSVLAVIILTLMTS